ncbi:MAG TPA: ABC transporter ATP-binding protein [Actinomycetota bacterium]|nr:ABC transporter ATP-binding protein [Actinomycetota bacterium]
MRRPEPLLALEGVTAGYGAAPPALHEVSLGVRSGEVVGLVGPNGSGKTTVVRVASRTLRPSAGAVRVVGRDPYAMPGRELARLVAVVPQDILPAFSFTALEMVLMGRTPYASAWGGGSPEDWARARSAMAAASVQHLADRPVEELSGGERQRVILAQALAQDAPVLLLDEPTSHLDVRHVVDVLAIVRGLAEREGAAVLAVLHDLNLAAIGCDRLVVLDRGAVVAEGEPASVLTHRLLRNVYGIDADVVVDDATGRPSVRLGAPRAVGTALGRRAHVVGGAGRGAPLFRRLAEVGFEVSVGILHASDTDQAAAERLNLLRVSVPPFSAIDPESARECRALMEAADLLVVCDAPFGPGNVENLRLALQVATGGVPTVLLEQVPIAERDFTGGEATQLWTALRDVAMVATSYEELAASAAG